MQPSDAVELRRRIVDYSGYILTQPGSDTLADSIRIPKGRTAPMFLVHASDDERGSQPEQSLALYRALRGAGVPVDCTSMTRAGMGSMSGGRDGPSPAGRSVARGG